MTSRRPTTAARLSVLERLAQANRDEGPDSTQFTRASWTDLERCSFLDGLNDLLEHQEERVAAEERRKVEEVREQALGRALQRARARRWEHQQIERAREERLERRIEDAQREAAEEAADLAADRQAIYDARLDAQSAAETWEREVTGAAVVQSKRRWGVALQASLAAAALICVVGYSALSQSKSAAGEELAAQWDLAADHERSAQTRVAELEAEIERRVNLTVSEKKLLEGELQSARQELAAAEKEKEEVDRRRPRRASTPTRLAVLPTTKVKPQATPKTPSSTVDSSVKLATEEGAGDGCLPYDPLCFEL